MIDETMKSLVRVVCVEFCGEHDGRVRENHYNITIREHNDMVEIEMYGLGKAHGEDSVPISWFKDKNTLCRKLYSFVSDDYSEDAFAISGMWTIWGSMYDLLLYITSKNLVINSIEAKLECGKLVDVKLN